MPLPLPPEAALSANTRALLATRAPIALYRTVAWSPPLLEPFLAMVAAFFERTTLSHRLREMVIVRVAMHHASRYEIHHHRELALRAGVTQQELDALLQPGACALDDPLASTLVRFTDEALTGHAPSPGTFAAAHAALGPQGTTELALLIGFYRMVATFVGAVGIEPDEYTAVQLRDRQAAADEARQHGDTAGH